MLALLAASQAGISQAHAAGGPDELRLARQSVRCSVVYGMAAAANGSSTSRAGAMQRDLMRVAPKLGASREQMDVWLSEFDSEFRDATAPSTEPGKRMRDEGFMPYQIDVCSNLLTQYGRELEQALLR